MDIIKEVKNDAQMLYTKKNVIELLSKQQEQKQAEIEEIKDAVVKKAAKWIKNHVHCYFQVWYDKMELSVHSDECAKDFIKTMK